MASIEFKTETENDSLDHIHTVFQSQKQAFSRAPSPTARERIKNLDRLHNALLKHKQSIIDAVNADFSGRSESETLLAEFFAVLDGIAYNRRHIHRWMKPQRRHTPLAHFPAKIEVIYQPLGVIGIVVPWNFPVFLGLSPLVGALAAGNRAMIKNSEFAPNSSTVIKNMLLEIFDEDQVAVIEGDVDISTAFTQLPFDHLVFTGATNVGKLVMAEAAKNLTPVTLELGGKSPALIHPEFPIAEAAKRLAFGKSFNAGQICVSPDYILCPNDKVNEFASAFQSNFEKSFPNLRDNDNFTAIINERQLSRLHSYLVDAKDKGAQLITINPADEEFTGTRKMPMTLVLNTNDDMLVVKEEIFGPILPIIGYDDMEQALSYINARPRPLALYYFDWNKKRGRSILRNTHSGGVCINDTLSHVASDDIPFGGIGPSGMGQYHGHEGFLNFSKAKGVVQKGLFHSVNFVAPPWNGPVFKLFLKMQALRFRPRRV